MSDRYPIDMSALVDFMNARIAEDEQDANYAIEEIGHGAWEQRGPDVVATDDRDRHITGTAAVDVILHIIRHDPDRALREVKAKRSHVVRFQQVSDLIDGAPTGIIRNELLSVRRAYMLVILDDATVYADHPDYRSEWRPAEGNDQ